jgi:hypothetical protein
MFPELNIGNSQRRIYLFWLPTPPNPTQQSQSSTNHHYQHSPRPNHPTSLITFYSNVEIMLYILKTWYPLEIILLLFAKLWYPIYYTLRCHATDLAATGSQNCCSAISFFFHITADYSFLLVNQRPNKFALQGHWFVISSADDWTRKLPKLCKSCRVSQRTLPACLRKLASSSDKIFLSCDTCSLTGRYRNSWKLCETAMCSWN